MPSESHVDLGSLAAPRGAAHRRKRVGRGESSGWGKTAGRGNKGQKARAGSGPTPGFEGGQMPLQRRLPKRGFRNIFKKKYAVINVGDLARFAAGSVVDFEALRQRRVVRRLHDGLRVLGQGELAVVLTVKAQYFTPGARRKIEAAGGAAEVVGRGE